MFNAFAAMVKIFLISAVGIFLAKFPRGEPLLPAPMIKYLSKLANNVFVPCLIMTSLGSAVTLQLLSRIGVLVFFCFIANSISYFFGHTIGLFLHGRSDDAMFTALVVAIGSPNAISLPLMVMQTMCEEKYVRADYNDSQSECFVEATSMLFVYSMGWHLMFWSYGFPKLKGIKQRFYSDLTDLSSNVICVDTINEESGHPILNLILKKISFRKNKDAFCSWLKTVFLTPAMIAIFVGIAIGLIPYTQELMFEKMSVLRPLGSALTTLGEPVVAINCLIMSASLAQVDFSNGRKKASEETKRTGDEFEISTHTDSSAPERGLKMPDSGDVNENATSLASIKSFLYDKLPVFDLFSTRKAKYNALLVDDDPSSNSASTCDISCGHVDGIDENSSTEFDNIEDIEALCSRGRVADDPKNVCTRHIVAGNFAQDTLYSTELGAEISSNHMSVKHPIENIPIIGIPIEKLRMKIPPPTYRSIFALIICR